MAMNIISKEKKDIRWIGLPTNSVQECQHIEVSQEKLGVASRVVRGSGCGFALGWANVCSFSLAFQSCVD